MDQSQARIKPFRQVPTQIRACDWSMLFAFAFARNTLTHFVIALLYEELLPKWRHLSLSLRDVCEARG